MIYFSIYLPFEAIPTFAGNGAGFCASWLTFDLVVIWSRSGATQCFEDWKQGRIARLREARHA